MEKQKNDVVNNLPNSNVNEYNVQNNIQKQTNKKMKKKINLSAILSFIFAVLGLCLAITINTDVYETQQASGADYMWPLGIVALMALILFPILLFALITGVIGLAKSYEKGYSYKWMAILGIVVSIISFIINYITMQQLS